MPSRHESHILISAESLTLELNQRAWSAAILARKAGVSPTTVSMAMNGRPISPRSALRILEALEKHPPRLVKLLAPREVA